ncbi:Ig domain protein [Leptospira wolffii serovar Khorat str. Khorat-H2]|nr:Ig domain protein [Leptospira wolffii serovar Khorat str. Khorat-H2]
MTREAGPRLNPNMQFVSDLRRVFLIVLFLFFGHCKASGGYNPADPGTSEFLQTQFLKCMLGELAECMKEPPPPAAPTIVYQKNLLDILDFYLGKSSSYSPTVTGTLPISYSISGSVPGGLAFNSSTGTVSGTPTGAGSSISLTVTATNSLGSSTDTFELDVWDSGAIPDTGKTGCTDNVGSAAGCYEQDGTYSNIPGFRIYSGPSIHPTLTNQQVSVDRVRGLYWKTCAEGQTDPSCSGPSTLGDWYSAGAACSNLNAGQGYAGFKNWRLPSMKELYTLVYLGSSTPLIEATYFPGAESVGFWSSTPNANSSVQAYGISFSTGASMSYNVYSTLATRCVAGNSLDAPVFNDLGNGVVQEQKTGLYYQKCNNGETYSAGSCSGGPNAIDWESAIAICDSFNLASLNWRLPNLNELHLLTDYTVASGPKVYSIFYATPGALYWSSSPVAGGMTENQAFGTAIDAGEMQIQSKGNYLQFRCVSSGP